MKYFPVFFLVFFVSCKTNVSENSYPTAAMEPLFGISLTMAERDSMTDGLLENETAYKALHHHLLENSIPPALLFNPIPVHFSWNETREPVNYGLREEAVVPENFEDLAFYSLADLSNLLKTGKVTSTQLTEMYLGRLKKYGDTLQCVVTLTEDLAREQAALADAEIAAGHYRGPLHGIPYGAKDLLAVEGYKTTWGAAPYQDQELTGTATVIKKLEEAGAVLVAKLTLGAIAYGDVWFGGKTKNPWNLKQGSSGSSAGSASATVAGLVAFAIGTETHGSIVSPSTRCGATGLRPTYGRVSRAGAMALSWSMDKIGPICREARDCAIVFSALLGRDGLDQSVYEAPFNFDVTRDPKKLRVGYIKSYFEEEGEHAENNRKSLETIRKMGVDMKEVVMPDDLPIEALNIILMAEASAAFDSLIRSEKDNLLVRQDKNAWPNLLRTARFIPAVEYINANRVRYQLVQVMYETLKEFDVVITPSFGGTQLLVTNLTGNPCVTVPNGFDEKGSPTSISFIGNLFEEGVLLEFAHAYQQATDFEEKHPELFR